MGYYYIIYRHTDILFLLSHWFMLWGPVLFLLLVYYILFIMGPVFFYYLFFCFLYYVFFIIVCFIMNGYSFMKALAKYLS